MIVDPYPGRRVQISDFQYGLPLVTSRAASAPRPGVEWMLVEPFTVFFKVDGERQRLTVPARFETDFSSVPRAFRWLVSKIGPHSEGSVLHDWLYEEWKRYRSEPRRIDKIFADQVFMLAMEAAQTDWLTRRAAYNAVRTFGWHAFST